MNLTAALRAEYDALYASCTVRLEKQSQVEATAAKIAAQQARYGAVADPLRVPWYVVGVLHSLETGLRFDRHLHNGDPLTTRTVHVPKDRPITGTPPFSWEASATDALQYEHLDERTDWTIPGTLFAIEQYNGWGYRIHHPDVLSPYLWSCSNHYTKGKFITDHGWSSTAISQQSGAVVLLRELVRIGDVTL
jgi:lysozyme family protein